MVDALHTVESEIPGFDQDAKAFKELMDEHQQVVFNAALNMVNNQADAEDITQDVFAVAFLSFHKFKGHASVRTWLYRIAVNKCIDFLRKKERQKKWSQLGNIFGIPNNSHETTEFVHPGTQAENREKAKILYRGIGNLPLRQRTAFILCETENLSYKQISEVMNLTVASVESLLFRAKKNLR
jgi:RNA polymerase sigma-70 factor (ECF subfamily)